MELCRNREIWKSFGLINEAFGDGAFSEYLPINREEYKNAGLVFQRKAKLRLEDGRETDMESMTWNVTREPSIPSTEIQGSILQRRRWSI